MKFLLTHIPGGPARLWARAFFVALSAAVVYALSLAVVDLLWGAVLQPLVVAWAGIWLEGAVFALLNARNEFFDLWAAVKQKRPLRTLIGGGWLLRWTAVSALCCVLMAAAGYSVIVSVGDANLRLVLLCLGGLCIVANQVLNSIDRERLALTP